jgi:uncharacterized protein (TIRG00374 family)
VAFLSIGAVPSILERRMEFALHITDNRDVMPDAIPPPEQSRRSGLRRSWPVLRYVVGFGGIGVAIWVLSSHTDELSGVTSLFDHMRWWWIPAGIVAEALSFVSFTAMEFQLLTARSGVRPPRFPLFRMTLGSQALTNSLPAGNAVSAVYGFRWFRRFGADDTLAVWAMAGTFIAAMLSLSLVATAGLALAADEGASLDLIPVLVGVLVITIGITALFLHPRPLFTIATWAARISRAIVRWPKNDPAERVDRIVQRITSVEPGWRKGALILVFGTANWLFDCACFAFMFLAIGAGIPWKGLLLAYGAGQLAAALPITPGGLGAVEGSITIALVAFGGEQVATVDAVLLYRLISFWLVLVVGWLLIGELALEVRRGTWMRHALDSPTDAALDAGGDEDDAREVDLEPATIALPDGTTGS